MSKAERHEIVPGGVGPDSVAHRNGLGTAVEPRSLRELEKNNSENIRHIYICIYTHTYIYTPEPSIVTTSKRAQKPGNVRKTQNLLGQHFEPRLVGVSNRMSMRDQLSLVHTGMELVDVQLGGGCSVEEIQRQIDAAMRL